MCPVYQAVTRLGWNLVFRSNPSALVASIVWLVLCQVHSTTLGCFSSTLTDLLLPMLVSTLSPSPHRVSRSLPASRAVSVSLLSVPLYTASTSPSARFLFCRSLSSPTSSSGHSSQSLTWPRALTHFLRPSQSHPAQVQHHPRCAPCLSLPSYPY